MTLKQKIAELKKAEKNLQFRADMMMLQAHEYVSRYESEDRYNDFLCDVAHLETWSPADGCNVQPDPMDILIEQDYPLDYKSDGQIF